MYYVIEALIVILFLIISTTSIVNTKVNDMACEKEFANLCQKIYNIQGTENDEIYIPVEKNSKYGYIDESNKEKIVCEYDRVTFFLNGYINGRKCYFALVEKDGNNYIISKSNNKINISDNKYFRAFLKKYITEMSGMIEGSTESYYTGNYTRLFTRFLTKGEMFKIDSLIDLLNIEMIDNSQNKKK